jgi:hypothetical protein
MKLKELLDQIFKNGPLPTNNKLIDYEVSYNLLSLIKDKLLECDEFKEVKSLTIINSTVYEGKTSHTAKLTDDYIFKGDVYINSISLTPTIYDPENWMKPIKDGCTITPTMYNPENFVPYKKIILNIDVENMADNSDGARVHLHKMLDQILENPKDYTPEGTRGILIRGIF